MYLSAEDHMSVSHQLTAAGSARYVRVRSIPKGDTLKRYTAYRFRLCAFERHDRVVDNGLKLHVGAGSPSFVVDVEQRACALVIIEFVSRSQLLRRGYNQHSIEG